MLELLTSENQMFLKQTYNINLTAITWRCREHEEKENSGRQKSKVEAST